MINTDIYEVLEALNKINLIKEPTHKYHEIIRPTYETLWAEGWDNIDDQKIIDIRTKIIEIINETDSSHRDETNRLLNDLNSIRKIASKLDKPTDLVLSHNDARQSNIAWHKEKGVMIVDWSWADMAPKKADTTMFLIDLAKNGHDVTNYTKIYFDKKHAIVMIGFWLSHSLHKTRDESNTIRIQQIASAVAAYKLVRSLGSL
jgi:thiamine kinase-like enzyme